MIHIERDVPIRMDDGIVLRADVFRPDETTPVPAILTLGPYGKGLPFQTGYKEQWEWLEKTHAKLLEGSTRSYLTWETVDPEIWVPWGYAVVRIDSRGAGRSPGYLDIYSPREVRDLHDAIEWAGTREWCNGKVGLNGISYFAVNQWLVASLQPPHLAAMIPWEGAADLYRDKYRHGGILSNAFLNSWFPRQVLSVQHGNAQAPLDPWTGNSVTGPDKLSEEELAANHSDPLKDALDHPLDDQFFQDRSADWSKVTTPFLSAASLAGYGLHPRGNFEAFTQASSQHKWLETHPGRHEEWFYLEEGMTLQKRFLDYFLKGEDNGWDTQPPVMLRLRRPFSSGTTIRYEDEWPLARTEWTSLHLGKDSCLHFEPTDGEISFDALGDPVTFYAPPLDEETELTGPLAATLYISSSTLDADLFCTLLAFDPDGREVHFPGTIDPATPLAQGWLRASHRKLDPEKTLPYRPYHSHDETQLLEPGHVYELQVEIWPTCVILPAGYSIALQVGGHDFERRGVEDEDDRSVVWTARGSGPFLHNHPEDRPRDTFGGRTTIHTGWETPSRLLLPVIPRG